MKLIHLKLCLTTVVLLTAYFVSAQDHGNLNTDDESLPLEQIIDPPAMKEVEKEKKLAAQPAGEFIRPTFMSLFGANRGSNSGFQLPSGFVPAPLFGQPFDAQSAAASNKVVLVLNNDKNKFNDAVQPAEESLKRITRNPDFMEDIVGQFQQLGGGMTQQLLQQVSQTAPDMSRSFGQALNEALTQTNLLAQVAPGNFNMSQLTQSLNPSNLSGSIDLGQLGQTLSQSFLVGATQNILNPNDDQAPSASAAGESGTQTVGAARAEAVSEPETAAPQEQKPTDAPTPKNPFEQMVGKPLLPNLPPFKWTHPFGMLGPLYAFSPLMPLGSEISEVRVMPEQQYSPYKISPKPVEQQTMAEMKLKALLKAALTKKTIPILWFHLPPSPNLQKPREDMEMEAKLRVFEQQVVDELKQLQNLSKMANELKKAQLQSGIEPSESLATNLNLFEIPIYDITLGDIEKTLKDDHVKMLMQSMIQKQKEFQRHEQATTKYLTDLTGAPIKRQAKIDEDVLKSMEKDDMMKMMSYAYRMAAINGHAMPWLRNVSMTSDGKKAESEFSVASSQARQHMDAEIQWMQDKYRQMAFQAQNPGPFFPNEGRQMAQHQIYHPFPHSPVMQQYLDDYLRRQNSPPPPPPPPPRQQPMHRNHPGKFMMQTHQSPFLRPPQRSLVAIQPSPFLVPPPAPALIHPYVVPMRPTNTAAPASRPMLQPPESLQNYVIFPSSMASSDTQPQQPQRGQQVMLIPEPRLSSINMQDQQQQQQQQQQQPQQQQIAMQPNVQPETKKPDQKQSTESNVYEQITESSTTDSDKTDKMPEYTQRNDTKYAEQGYSNEFPRPMNLSHYMPAHMYDDRSDDRSAMIAEAKPQMAENVGIARLKGIDDLFDKINVFGRGKHSGGSSTDKAPKIVNYYYNFDGQHHKPPTNVAPGGYYAPNPHQPPPPPPPHQHIHAVLLLPRPPPTTAVRPGYIGGYVHQQQHYVPAQTPPTAPVPHISHNYYPDGNNYGSSGHCSNACGGRPSYEAYRAASGDEKIAEMSQRNQNNPKMMTMMTMPTPTPLNNEEPATITELKMKNAEDLIKSRQKRLAKKQQQHTKSHKIPAAYLIVLRNNNKSDSKSSKSGRSRRKRSTDYARLEPIDENSLSALRKTYKNSLKEITLKPNETPAEALRRYNAESIREALEKANKKPMEIAAAEHEVEVKENMPEQEQSQQVTEELPEDYENNEFQPTSLNNGPYVTLPVETTQPFYINFDQQHQQPHHEVAYDPAVNQEMIFSNMIKKFNTPGIFSNQNSNDNKIVEQNPLISLETVPYIDDYTVANQKSDSQIHFTYNEFLSPTNSLNSHQHHFSPSGHSKMDYEKAKMLHFENLVREWPPPTINHVRQSQLELNNHYQSQQTSSFDHIVEFIQEQLAQCCNKCKDKILKTLKETFEQKYNNNNSDDVAEVLEEDCSTIKPHNLSYRKLKKEEDLEYEMWLREMSLKGYNTSYLTKQHQQEYAKEGKLHLHMEQGQDLKPAENDFNTNQSYKRQTIVTETKEAAEVVTAARRNKNGIEKLELKENKVELKDDAVELKEDEVELKDDAVELKEDEVELKDDAVELKEDEVELKDDAVELKKDKVDLKENEAGVENEDDEDQYQAAEAEKNPASEVRAKNTPKEVKKRNEHDKTKPTKQEKTHNLNSNKTIEAAESSSTHSDNVYELRGQFRAHTANPKELTPLKHAKQFSNYKSINKLGRAEKNSIAKRNTNEENGNSSDKLEEILDILYDLSQHSKEDIKLTGREENSFSLSHPISSSSPISSITPSATTSNANGISISSNSTNLGKQLSRRKIKKSLKSPMED